MKKMLQYGCALVMVLMLTLSAGMTASAEGGNASLDAQQVAFDLAVSPYGRETANMKDGREYSYYAAKKDSTLSVTGKQPFTRLYMQFEKPCVWTVTLPDGTVKQGGENGFLHELMELGQAVDSVEIAVSSGTLITDIYAFTDGELPEWVQLWQPPCEKADLLLLPTHADDEHLWFGGAMPYYAGELGYEVQVVYLTNHANYKLRNHELLNGLWTVGVRHYPVISDQFIDRMETKYYYRAERIFGYENVLAYQVEILRRFSPRVVIGHDIRGEYGHGAHIMNAKTLLEALELTDDPTAFPESAQAYGTCQVQKCYLHLWPEHRIEVNWGDMPLSHFGGQTALEMAKKGFACHATQTKYFRVLDSGLYDCRKFGLAYTTVGDDTEGLNDMFEHVDWSDKQSVNRDEEIVSASDAVSVSDADADGGAAQGFLSGRVAVIGVAAAAVVLVTVVLIIVLRRCKKRIKD